MKKYFYLFLLIPGLLIYGILIGRYGYFPFDQIKSLQDKFDGTVKKKPGSFSEIDVRKLISVNPGNADSIRTILTGLIFDTAALPSLLPDSVIPTSEGDYAGLENLKSIDQFTIKMNYGINSTGYIFHPVQDRNRLAIYHEGHKGDFINGKNTISFFLKKGFTVYAFAMPLLGKNNQPYVYLDKLGEVFLNDHEMLRYLKKPIQYFITPVIAMLNYAGTKNFHDITMVGLSGGGWTATVAAAIDKRINYSFSVAGSYPMFIKLRNPEKDYGDFEQVYEEIYSRVDYLDMYVLGSVGKNRRQLQVYNKYDPCCFDGEDYKAYQSEVAAVVSEFSDGKFGVFPDTHNRNHDISDESLHEISKFIK
jgi:hypothetical protein